MNQNELTGLRRIIADMESQPVMVVLQQMEDMRECTENLYIIEHDLDAACTCDGCVEFNEIRNAYLGQTSDHIGV
jgi:chromosome condensin MukBEF ATPase and DNA-binding subunit MukB